MVLREQLKEVGGDSIHTATVTVNDPEDSLLSSRYKRLTTLHFEVSVLKTEQEARYAKIDQFKLKHKFVFFLNPKPDEIRQNSDDRSVAFLYPVTDKKSLKAMKFPAIDIKTLTHLGAKFKNRSVNKS